MAKKIAAYGSWKSSITSDLIVAGSIGLDQLRISGDALYWTEGRPTENGRSALVKWTPKHGFEEMSAAGFNVRSRVHEYGGGAYVVHDDTIYFSNFVDQRLYVQYPHSEPEPLTPNKPLRFADGTVDAQRGRLFCIREDHTAKEQEPSNSLVSLNLDSHDERGEVLASGNNFYASPCISLNGRKLTWLSWNHPNMPWDGTELWVADLNEAGTQISNKALVAGGLEESVFQPKWSPAGELYFVSDRTNWWNLYRWREGVVQAICPMDAEFGLPQWVFGMSTYGFAGDGRIICSYTQNGRWHLARLDTETGELTPIDTPYSSISNLQVADGVVAFIGGSATHPASIVRLDLQSNEMQVLRQTTSLTIDTAYLSVPQAVEFPTENGLTAHAIYYPPQNRDFTAPEGTAPPLLVLSHGGPTSASQMTLSLGTQYWTSRGFAVLDVNYGGSTGYGRSYRQRLNGQWGVVDVQDCVNGAKYLVEQGLADGQQLAIRGGSAGGYTTLCALTFYNTFNAGASYFGVSDVEVLALETHKFESRYLDSMIGSYPEAKGTYIERSPIHFTNQINCPLILFQGLDDEVVPPNQAEMMFEAVKGKGIPVAHVAFPGEGHGFRSAENIKRALDGELYFYGRIFNFKLADPVKPVEIENLPTE
ncbi:Prolyl oligopeptidase family protein [hydrothermal vent metagenome]|uniref:Prolyl oligopeptidase family protein n=1 Tax=hydrothermal vent metagenome TaxID=652676 RepID=A0A3B0WFY0_9ZZZZ